MTYRVDEIDELRGLALNELAIDIEGDGGLEKGTKTVR
jgi:hypothetical protein